MYAKKKKKKKQHQVLSVVDEICENANKENNG